MVYKIHLNFNGQIIRAYNNGTRCYRKNASNSLLKVFQKNRIRKSSLVKRVCKAVYNVFTGTAFLWCHYNKNSLSKFFAV